MKTAFVFPGQGSQKVGMLQDLYNAYPIVKQRFEEADEALGYSISKLCFEGPDTELVKTANTQPAILTASGKYSCAARRLVSSTLLPTSFIPLSV